MKHVVITGATGIVGISLVKCMLEYEVAITVILRPHSNRERNLPVSDKVRKVYCELSQLHKLSKENIGSCDVFYHLAWEGAAYARDDVRTQLANVNYTLDAIRLAKELGGKFVGVGSQAEYGQYSGTVQPEAVPKPTCAYGIAKMTAQKLGEIYAKQIGIPFIWTRIFSIYGPHDLDKTLIMSCIKALEEQKTIDLTKCEQIWDFLYSDDAAEAYYRIGIAGRDGTIYNICSGITKKLDEFINQLDEKYRELFDTQGKIIFGTREYSENQVMFLGGDITSLNKDTGFTPRISFEEGVKRTILWHAREKKDEN